MPITPASYSEALDPLVFDAFMTGAKMRPSVGEQFFNIRGTQSYQEIIARVGGLSVDAWDTMRLTGTIADNTPDMLPGKRITIDPYVVRYPVPVDLMADNRVPEILDQVTILGVSAAQKREFDMASVFVNAFSGTAGPDSLPLCYATHTGAPTGFTSNTATAALTAANVSTGRKTMAKFRDDRGNPMPAHPDVLLVPPDLYDAAVELARSEKDPASANNAANPRFGSLRVVEWPYLTDTDSWFLIDTVAAKMALKWLNREPLRIVREPGAEVQWINYYAKMRYSFGFADWRWVYGGNAS